jgi:hypothetical protein
VRQDEAQGAGTTLADFVAGTAWADVAAQNHEAKRSILNFFATALGSANDPAVTAALRTLLPFSGAATSAVIGRPEQLDATPIWTLSSIRRRPLLRRCWHWRKRAGFRGGQYSWHSFSA